MFSELVGKIKSLLSGPSFDERRQEPRAQGKLEVSCMTSKGAILSTVLDVSSSGLRFGCDQKLSKGQKVKFSPPRELAGAATDAIGRVHWCKKIHSGYYQAGVQLTGRKDTDWVKLLLLQLGLTNQPPVQRRKHIRVPAQLPVQLRTQAGNTESALLKDLSLGGALVAVPFRLPIDGIVRLKIGPLPNVGLLNMPTNVCHQQKVSSGFHASLKFASNTTEETEQVTKYLNYLLKNRRG